jgi:hypothetical protein
MLAGHHQALGLGQHLQARKDERAGQDFPRNLGGRCGHERGRDVLRPVVEIGQSHGANRLQIDDHPTPRTGHPLSSVASSRGEW